FVCLERDRGDQTTAAPETVGRVAGWHAGPDAWGHMVAERRSLGPARRGNGVYNAERGRPSIPVYRQHACGQLDVNGRTQCNLPVLLRASVQRDDATCPN